MLPRRFKNIFLLITSYTFYGYWDYRFCSLLAISTIIDYFVGARLFTEKNNQKRKLLLLGSLVVNLGILGFFKYFNFFLSSFETMINPLGGNLDYLHLNIILPVGISFYTFQTLSYTIDIYREKLKPTTNFIDFALFVSFFPQLVAGPIERATNLLPQIASIRTNLKINIGTGVWLIIVGLFKKVMIGDNTGRIVDRIFGQPEIYTSAELLMGLVLFSIQIYADFSGYSSIARGTARLLGIKLIKNFRQPYLAENITDFWRRWHISLSQWLRDYLYIPLGGNRNGKQKKYINLMITMLLGGLWHGASWNFVIWGGLHGFYLTFHKLFSHLKMSIFDFTIVNNKLVKIISTYIIVLFAWLFFRAIDTNTIIIFFNKMLHWESSEFTFRFIKITGGFLFITYLIDIIESNWNKTNHIMTILKHKPIFYSIMSVMAFITLLHLFQTEPQPFVYFQF